MVEEKATLMVEEKATVMVDANAGAVLECEDTLNEVPSAVDYLVVGSGKAHGTTAPNTGYILINGRSSYARAMIELRASVKLKDTIVVAMPKLVWDGFYMCTIRSSVVKNLKNPSQASRGVPVGPKVGFKSVKQVYRHVSKKNNVNTSGNKKKDAESRKEVSNPNLFGVFNSVMRPT
uniref:Uncharacterized protein n=1 Tax=Tanacetum cinerariifolium TaxID=118510 RepID=A0A6L2LBI5_TANCI|nr:hypothetical protein [Tanacetum cinerariifolium]